MASYPSFLRKKKRNVRFSLPPSPQLPLISLIISGRVSSISYAEFKKLQVEGYSILPLVGHLIVDFSVISSSGALIVTTSSCAPTEAEQTARDAIRKVHAI